jgi:DNA-binding transcriptional regulator PaaX
MNKLKKEKLSEKRLRRKKVKKLTFGVTDALTNIALYSIYVGANMLAEGGKGPVTVNRAFDKADSWIGKLDAKKLRRALYNLHQQGLITSVREAAVLPKITENGINKIKNILPAYDEKRVWDKNLYTIYYDIPIQKNNKRNILREYLKKLKAVKLQDSIYLTPYNPENIIDKIINEYNIEGQILISTINPYKGLKNIGNIKDFLWDIYGLEKVNRKYKKFIEKKKRSDKAELKQHKMKIAFEYFSILEDDPQIPFELLSDKYLGDEAYLLYKKAARA